MSADGSGTEFDRLARALAAAAGGNGPWRPALESLLLLARAARPGDEALVAAALRQASHALAANARRVSSRRGEREEREAALR